jgi:ABC-type sugar transport system ATPase subunit
VIGELDVCRNVFLGAERRGRRTLSRRDMVAATRRALDQLGEDLDVRAPVASLSVGERQLLEVVRVLALVERYEAEAPVILLDEPTTALDSGQEERLLALVERLRGAASFVFVSHRLEEVLRVSDRLVVLKDGRNAGERPAAGATEPELHALMVGRERAANHYREDLRAEPAGGDRLVVEGLVLDGHVGPVDLRVGHGEIVGVAGLLGSGKSALARCIAGDLRPTRGTMAVDGHQLAPGLLGHAIARGLAFVPGERAGEGLIAEHSVLHNVQLPSLRDRLAGPLGGWRRGRALDTARSWADRLGVVPRDPAVPVAALSGGNQQKVLLAKWVAREPRVLVVENPTRGVDTGAREAIYALLRELAAQGVAVLLVSDDLTEVIGLSDRIVVMVAGRVEEVVPAAPPEGKPSEERLLAPMLGGGRKGGAR